jgi:hypothetical protein
MTPDEVLAAKRAGYEQALFRLSPNASPSVLPREEMELLRPVNTSMGMMLESTSRRLARLTRG